MSFMFLLTCLLLAARLYKYWGVRPLVEPIAEVTESNTGIRQATQENSLIAAGLVDD